MTHEHAWHASPSKRLAVPIIGPTTGEARGRVPDRLDRAIIEMAADSLFRLGGHQPWLYTGHLHTDRVRAGGRGRDWHRRSGRRQHCLPRVAVGMSRGGNDVFHAVGSDQLAAGRAVDHGRGG